MLQNRRILLGSHIHLAPANVRPRFLAKLGTARRKFRIGKADSKREEK